MEPDQQMRNLRDFLLVYNRMTEICFQRCGSNFNYRNLTMDEVQCVDNCAGKLIRSNHRIMGTYVQLMPRMMQRRMNEMESKVAEAAKAAEAAASAPLTPPEALPTEMPPVLPSPATDVGPGAHGAALTSHMPQLRDAQQSSDVKLSAIAPVTPAANPSVISQTGSGPS